MSRRITGRLLGGAVGDALGAPVEFMSLRLIRERYGPDGIRELERSRAGVATITDDTQMTLFTADGLLRWLAASEGEGTGDPRPRLYRAYLRWLDTQGDPVPPQRYGEPGWLHGVDDLHVPRAPGRTCLSALRSGEMGTRDHPLNDSKGCGGVMRAAPAGLIGAEDPFGLGCDLAAITHSHPTGYLAAGFLAVVIHELVRERSLEEAVDRALARLDREPGSGEVESAVRQAITLSAEGDPAAKRVELLGEGWIAEEALAIALYCALAHPTDFEAAVRLAVNHSGDADSTGAITGNVLGALRGRDAIPERWLSVLELHEEIERIARDLETRFRPDEEWMARYPPR